MTAKEKAEELFDKMAFEVCGTDAKICALIAVDEILNTLNPMSLDYEYWEEVNQHIKQL